MRKWWRLKIIKRGINLLKILIFHYIWLWQKGLGDFWIVYDLRKNSQSLYALNVNSVIRGEFLSKFRNLFTNCFTYFRTSNLINNIDFRRIIPFSAMHNLQNCWLNELFLLFFHYFKSGIINHSYCARDNYPGIQIHKKYCS